jgi:hypothetical protein
VPRRFTPTVAYPSRRATADAGWTLPGFDGSYPEYSTTVGYGPASAGPGSETSTDSFVPSRVVM